MGVILAAGGSSRFGRPKQLLPYAGSTLIERLVREVNHLPLLRCLVILGAHRREIRPYLRNLPVETVVNRAWREGLSSSIRLAIGWARETLPSPSGLLFTAVDQVLVERSGLSRLLKQFEEDRNRIVVSRYGDTGGIPAIFGSAFLDALEGLTGDCGARALLQRYSRLVQEVEMEAAALDIDRPADWEAFTRSDTMRS